MSLPVFPLDFEISCSLCSCFIRRSNRDFESRGERETAIISIHSSPSLVASGVRLLLFARWWLEVLLQLVCICSLSPPFVVLYLDLRRRDSWILWALTRPILGCSCFCLICSSSNPLEGSLAWSLDCCGRLAAGWNFLFPTACCCSSSITLFSRSARYGPTILWARWWLCSVESVSYGPRILGCSSTLCCVLLFPSLCLGQALCLCMCNVGAILEYCL